MSEPVAVTSIHLCESVIFVNNRRIVCQVYIDTYVNHTEHCRLRVECPEGKESESIDWVIAGQLIELTTQLTAKENRKRMPVMKQRILSSCDKFRRKAV